MFFARLSVAASQLAGLCLLAGCADRDAEPPAGPAATQSAAAISDDAALAEAPSSVAAAPATAAASSDPDTLTLDGLGDLVIGEPVPAGSSFAERGAQIGDTCRTVSSPRYPGIYAITAGKNGPVRRITIGQRSDIKLVEGIGVGAREQDVLAAFPGFRASPHKYIAAPGKDLIQPGNAPRLRFEIGGDRRVSLMHVGLMPELGFVEGCA